MARTRTKNGITAGLLFSVVFGMVGLAFASVPLYQWFCQVTGFAGTPNIISAPVAVAPSEKTITVRLDANVNPALPWGFRPERTEITVRAGEPALAFYKAVNQSDGPITGTATYNVTPCKAGEYFSKIDCFCFTEQWGEGATTLEWTVESPAPFHTHEDLPEMGAKQPAE